MTIEGATKQPDGQINSDCQKSCQVENFCKSKIFLLSADPNQCASIAIPSHSEGVGRRHGRWTGCGGRWFTP
ncbi:hypothetical protein, partial [Bradyrhizobium sp. AUGA SZCCT0177]|uniref:hypothetical protein n=1 Tax=Bradyrhizobium sp. AUGA SZCCT0177 TaxID=2807665 RepID=UPI001BAD3988